MAIGPSIDVLDYDALVAEAQRRIIARSRGQWTLHAPVDPGITLIELFAWLLDQRSYWAAQPDDDSARAIMRLLGDRPRPARAAAVPITSTDPLAAGQRLRFAQPGSTVVVSVDDALDPLPLASAPIAVRTDGIDTGADLRAHRPFELLRAGGGATRAEIDIALVEPLTDAHAVSLAVLIETDGAIEPAWSPDATTAPVPAVLAFTYRATGGAWRPLTADDGTGGLRRSGLVRFTLPADASVIVGPERWTYTIAIATLEATFTAPPIVTRLCANATTAHHQAAQPITVAEPPLPLPGRVIELAVPPIEGTVQLAIVEADLQTYAWTPVDDFTGATPGDRVFVVDRERSCLRFGDGLTGRLPYAARTSGAITGSYLAGGGLAGNVGTGTWIGVTEAVATAVGARSIAPATGGRDSEALTSAQLRVADALHVRTRAATAEDYAVIATTTPGVVIARAHAAIGFDPAEPCVPAPGVVTVFVVPGVPQRTPGNVRVAAPIADPGAIAAVAARLAATRLLGTHVVVAPARYRDVEIRVQIVGDPWDPADTRARAEATIRDHLDPLFGGAEHTGWPFGGPIRPSDLMRVVQDAIAEDGEVTLVGISLGAPASDPDGDAIACGDARAAERDARARRAAPGVVEVTCGDVALASYELPRIASLRVQIVAPGSDA